MSATQTVGHGYHIMPPSLPTLVQRRDIMLNALIERLNKDVNDLPARECSTAILTTATAIAELQLHTSL